MKKKGIIAIAVAVVVTAGGACGYLMYQKQAEKKAYETKMEETIKNLPPIVVYEKEDLPTVEEEFAGTDSIIDINSIQPDISNVYTTEPGEYDVKYTFNDSNGEQRTATVKCNVKPELSSHVTGMQSIEIDKGDALPTDSGCTFDEYVDSVTLNTDEVDNEEAGIYDISYTILGADGDMKTVDGYTCTVNEVAPTPTPTPSPTPEPTKAPKKKEKKPEKKQESNTEETNTENNNENQQNGNSDAVGNVEVQNNVVATGDENNVAAMVIVLVIGVAAIVGVAIFLIKKKKK